MAEAIDIKKLYPEIAEMQVAEVISSDIFKEQLTKVLAIHKPPRKFYFAYISLKKNGTLEVDNFIKEYLLCIDKQSKMPFDKRVVIYSIGNHAYTKTIKKLMADYDANKTNEKSGKKI